MPHRAPSAAPFISRKLEEPYETLLGGETAHHCLASSYADALHPLETRLSRDDLYRALDMLPLTLKAENILMLIEHVTGPAPCTAEAEQLAKRITNLAGQFGLR
ncbi:hypothetical protein ACFVZH_22535 [Streptomyces sp. NPDC059534]|uniref:hypothetical protein n=1 Tax=Streptomyces sp. NPDC059534 TaxID=3346859 RepID=UPI00367F1022